MESPIAVLGAGSWGTALARHLGQHGETLRLWVRETDLCATLRAERVNTLYLPGFEMPPSIEFTDSAIEACRGASLILLVVPAQHCRRVLSEVRDVLTQPVPVIVASKGIETRTLERVSEIVEETLGPRLAGTVALSGPSFAREVAAGSPTALVAASANADLARRAQALLSRGSLRVYTSDDPVGVELGGALKNVIAIAAGVVEGLGLGANTTAALITRGLAEISRLAIHSGGRRETLSGLSGLGDLVLTCTGSQSRNRSVGFELGRGRRLEEILSGMQMVAEGVDTARAARDLGRRSGIAMPITEKVSGVLFEELPPAEAIRDLLSRPPRPEED